jgi:hypothetical protein
MAERLLITKLVRTDRTRADLYAKGHQWPDLKLFDVTDLLDVGIDPNSLEIGQEAPCRFWAIYELSDKLNKAGNPYKDVLALEPLDKPATVTSTENSALLVELRAIRALLEALVEAQAAGTQPSGRGTPDAPDRTSARYGDGSPLSDNPAEQEAFDAYLEAEGRPAESVAVLRRWFQTR